MHVKQDYAGNTYLEVHKKGFELIHDPLLNKGSSFSKDEIDALQLRGIVPPHQSTLEETVEKIYGVLNQKPDNLEKHIYLRALQDRNETLFYALIKKYTKEIMPLVYTPVVGKACQEFSHIYRRPRGLFIRYEDREYLTEILANSYFDETAVIVVSDGERILGLGDQGAGGMGIPIGKLSLYTACAGIAPQKTLPVLLDVGTDNQELLDDPLYIGSRHKRIRGREYDNFVDQFVEAIKKRFPAALLQWEDFAQPNALKLLNRYRDQLCTFNDDIQGTAAIVLSALLAAVADSDTPLASQQVVVVGAGSAGVGISNLIVKAMVNEGMQSQQAHEQIYLVDRHGLITDCTENKDFQQPFAKPVASLEGWTINDQNNITLDETVQGAQATMLIGVCAQGGIFTREVIEQMKEYTEHPIVFPLSNPTDKAEANPHDVLEWTSGKARVGTGSPFPPYTGHGLNRNIDQVNNAYIFPGMGLGSIAVKAAQVTDTMFLTAAQTVAALAPAQEEKGGNLLPELTQIRQISRTIAIAVGKEAVKEGVTPEPWSDKEVVELIDQTIWEPVYLPYRYRSKPGS